MNEEQALEKEKADQESIAHAFEQLGHLKVDELEFSVRTRNVLNNQNVITIADLCQKTESEMREWSNFGRKSFQEVEDKLAGLGVRLGMRIAC